MCHQFWTRGLLFGGGWGGRGQIYMGDVLACAQLVWVYMGHIVVYGINLFASLHCTYKL